ncbi:MAG: hypothetical protein DRP97_03065, partial [Candidatus Latescibacterota bacterium]
LASFTAQALGDEIVLKWRTESEIDNLGFHIYRAMEENGPYARLTEKRIAGQGSSTLPSTYVFTDSEALKGMSYYYKLEDTAFDGTKKIYGPVMAKPTPLVFRSNWGQVKALMRMP